jgi:hypothetical protein
VLLQDSVPIPIESSPCAVRGKVCCNSKKGRPMVRAAFVNVGFNHGYSFSPDDCLTEAPLAGGSNAVAK